MLGYHKIYWIFMVYAHLLQHFVDVIYALFLPNFLAWIKGSTNVFAFRMYGSPTICSLSIKSHILDCTLICQLLNFVINLDLKSSWNVQVGWAEPRNQELIHQTAQRGQVSHCFLVFVLFFSLLIFSLLPIY